MPRLVVLKIESHLCYVLHQRSYKENSALLDVFSSLHGRIGLVAKGIKNKKRPQNALIQPSQRLNIAWSIRGDLGTLTHVEHHSQPCVFSGKDQLAVFYLNELIIRLLHQHEPHPKLFESYDRTLSLLGAGENVDFVLRIFEKKLLDELGYGLILDHDVETGEEITSTDIYYYQIEYGPVKSPPATGGYIQISGATLLSLRKESLQNPESLTEAKHLMRASLNQHLGHKPLASRELYRAYLKYSWDA